MNTDHIRIRSRLAICTAIATLLASGCDNKPQQPAAGPAAGPAPAATAPATPVGADDEDEPDSPAELPRTGELKGWVKTRPVRVFSAARLAEAADNERERTILSAYRLHRAARCTYKNGDVTASVLLLEAGSPDDAFGVFSVMSRASRQEHRADGSVATEEKVQDTTVLSGWHGTRCVSIAFFGASDAGAKAIDQLFRRIMFMIPAANTPVLLQFIPEGLDVRAWLVRKAELLAHAPDETLKALAVAGTSDVLGLSGEARLTVASVRATPDAPRSLVWLVHYPDATGAEAAYERVKAKADSGSAEIDRHTQVESPLGVCLVGTWTADVKDTASLVAALKASLPGSPTTAPATSAPPSNAPN